jgi:hypothetical protein
MASNGQSAETQPGRQPPGIYFDFVSRPAPGLRRRSDIAGFVGMTATSPDEKLRRMKASSKPVKYQGAFCCESWQEFLDQFGSPLEQGYLGAAVSGFFANGGRRCWIAPARRRKYPSAGRLTRALECLAGVDEVSLIAVPDAGVLKKQGQQQKVWQSMVLQAEQLGDRIALLDPPIDWIAQKEWEGRFPVSESALAALYWPWLRIPSDTLDRDGGGYTRAVPPSGHIAGTIARRDIGRGVFAPPANMVIEGAAGVAGELTRDLRAEVNAAGINVIVALPGRGVRAMGARTLNKDNQEYKWLNVRRLVTHLCEWIAEDTQWTVFEPNSEVLWRATERLVRTILFDLWRRGGLVGATDDEAYFVRCDSTTNPPEEIEQGRVICVVGLRPPPPAEMITVRVGIAEGRVELLDREVTNG